MEINNKLFIIKNVDCEQSPQNFPELYKEPISSVYRCPKNCNSLLDNDIYGTDVYRDDSRLCKAAIHSGNNYSFV